MKECCRNFKSNNKFARERIYEYCPYCGSPLKDEDFEKHKKHIVEDSKVELQKFAKTENSSYKDEVKWCECEKPEPLPMYWIKGQLEKSEVICKCWKPIKPKRIEPLSQQYRETMIDLWRDQEGHIVSLMTMYDKINEIIAYLEGK
jgi:hypothetical protein